MNTIAIFCSGGGSNAEKILAFFSKKTDIRIGLIVVNKPNIGAITHANNYGIPTILVNKSDFYNTESLLGDLAGHKITHIVLAGWLWLIPVYLLQAYPEKIINIHPSLLPKYGGKGMYGHHVHEAVFANKETISGMTIHLVNTEFDKGKVLFQEAIDLETTDEPNKIAAKVLALEHKNYALVIEKWIVGA
jgi:phosphoribosylglycinamide formyltransferase-1